MKKFHLTMAALALAAGTAHAANIEVLTAWYGQSCGAQHGNVTAHIKAVCDGRDSCDYRVNAEHLGDPTPDGGRSTGSSDDAAGVVGPSSGADSDAAAPAGERSSATLAAVIKRGIFMVAVVSTRQRELARRTA